MKFLCDSCKAKYQIADEKVAGKTVRMKCRKCGHLIEIRAGQALSETSSLMAVPAEELSQIQNNEELAAELGVTAPEATGATPKPAAIAATSALKKPGLAPRPVAAAPAASAARPAASAAAALKAPAAAPAVAPKPLAAPKPLGAPRPLTAPKPAGGLASAFNKQVEAKPAEEAAAASRAIDMTSEGASDEWYVGINGVPVGPVRLTEVRAKAAAGQVNEESLVWREGFEEWLPLRNFPELLALLGAASSESMSSATPPPLGKPGLSGASTRLPPSLKANVVPLRSEPIKAPEPSPQPAAVAAPVAPAPAPSPAPAPVAKSEPEVAAPAFAAAFADPFADSPAPAPVAAPVAAPAVAAPEPIAPVIAPAPAVAAPVPASSIDEVAPRQQQAKMPVAAWVAIVLALVTGVTAGVVFSQKSEQQPQVQIVTVTVPAPTTAVPAEPKDSVAAAPAETTEIEPAPEAKADTNLVRKAAGGAAVGTTATAKAVASAAPLALLSNLSDAPTVNPTPGGPSLGPSPSPHTASAGGGSDPMPASSLQQVVNANRNSLKRACWEPALSAKGGSATSAKVTISFTVGRDGRVSRASASGGDAFPSLGPCISNRVKAWSFPTGFSETPTSATFSFVSQG